MRHALGGGFGIAGQTVPADIDAGREHQAVVRKLRAVAERHRASLRVDRGAGRDLKHHLIAGKFVVTEFLRPDLAQSGDDAVAEWAGDECRVSFDQRHGDARIDALDETGASCSAEASAHDDHASAGALGDRRKRQQRCSGRCRFEEFTPAAALCAHDGLHLSPSGRRTRRRWL
jgi:hypothetical protein